MLKTIQTLSATLALALITATAQADPFTMQFNALEVSGTDTTSAVSFGENGFSVTAGSFETLASANQDRTGWYAGSAGVYNESDKGTILLTQDNGAAFTMNSIRLAQMSSDYGTGASVTFTGTKMDGSTQVVQTFYVSNLLGEYETFLFYDVNNSFDNLLSVSWVQTAPYHQFDDISLSIGVLSAVPEPASYALMLLGLGYLAMRQTHKKK